MRSTNPTIFNLTRWVAGSMGQSHHWPSVWCSMYFFFHNFLQNGLETKPRTYCRTVLWKTAILLIQVWIIKSYSILQLKESRCHRLKQIMTMVFYVLGSKLQVTFLHIGNANFPADPLLCGMANFTLQMVWKLCFLMLPIFYSSLQKYRTFL